MLGGDTNMHCQADSVADIEAMINSDLNNVHQWLLSNKLTLSVEKTEYMVIGSRQRLNQILTNPDIVMGDNKINKVLNKTFLGVILDEQRNWHDHINKQCTKISKNIALLIRRAKNYITENTLNTMYNALGLPHLHTARQYGTTEISNTLTNLKDYKNEHPELLQAQATKLDQQKRSKS